MDFFVQNVLPYILLIVGFFILIKGADFFVEGSSSIAKKLRIPDIIVGLTIVAMGTSAPELAVSVSAAVSGSSDIAIGNVVGSNLLNILIVLGVSAVIVPLTVDKSIFKRDFPVLMITAIILPIMTIIGDNNIGRIAGIILLVLLAAYLFLTVKSAIAYRKSEAAKAESETIKVLPWWKSILFTVCGAAAIIIGADISVDNAILIAQQLNISESVIGLTVIALGTSLPELVTSVVAAKKGNSDMALGNVIGSNILNVLLILGLTATIKPFAVDFNNLIDQFILLGVTAYLLVTSITGKKISRIEGVTYVLIYAGYTVYLFLR